MTRWSDDRAAILCACWAVSMLTAAGVIIAAVVHSRGLF